MRVPIAVLIIAVSALVTSCGRDGATAPDLGECAARYACQVPGVDLVLVDVDVDTTLGVTVGTVMVDPRAIHVRFKVLNRGDKATAGEVEVSAFGLSQRHQLRTIAPGDSSIDEATLSFTRAYLLAGRDHSSERPIARITTTDADVTNNAALGPVIAPMMPFVTLDPSPAVTRTIGINSQIAIQTVFRVQMPPGANQQRPRLFVCFKTGAQTCAAGGWQPLVVFNASQFGSSINTNVTVFAQHLPNPPAGTYDLMFCAVPGDYTGALIEPGNPDHQCRKGPAFVVN